MRIKNYLNQQQVCLQKVPPTLKYFGLSMTSILLSLLLPIAEYQLLVLALITGVKWIADTKKNNILIIERGQRW